MKHYLVVVLLGKDLGVVDRLHRGVVVVLVHFLVDGGLHTVFLSLSYGLLGDGGRDVLMNGGVMVSVRRQRLFAESSYRLLAHPWK